MKKTPTDQLPPLWEGTDQLNGLPRPHSAHEMKEELDPVEIRRHLDELQDKALDNYLDSRLAHRPYLQAHWLEGRIRLLALGHMDRSAKAKSALDLALFLVGYAKSADGSELSAKNSYLLQELQERVANDLLALKALIANTQ